MLDNASAINIDSMLPKNNGLFYSGEWHSSSSGEQVATVNPATGEVLAQVHFAGAEDVAKAVAAAIKGFDIWKTVAPLERGKLLFEAADIVEKHASELAMLDAADCGNPVAHLLKDAVIATEAMRYFAGLVLELKGETMPSTPTGFNFSRREPLGVIARLSAYNHPFMFAVARMAAPLAAGNAVIVKSPHQAPLSTLRLAELLGPLFPPGVVNFLSGGRECGEALVAHPQVAKIGLIGSVPTGKAIMRAGADTLKRLSLELGGKNALIAYGDARPSDVVAGAIKGMNFGWCGQSCGSTSRLLLHESIHDEVVALLADAVSAMKPGIPTKMETSMGCLIDQAQFDKVVRYVESGLSQGARLVAGGKRPNAAELANGHFFLPTVFADVTPDMAIAREEIFGPVLSMMKWSDEDEMFRIANGLDVGLTASIWTRDLTRAMKAVERVEAGFVWVNNTANHYTGSPFGGYKTSGIGREESIDELLECSQIKHVNINFL